MTAAEFKTHVLFKTRVNDTVFADATMLALMKIRQDEIARKILAVDEDILLIPMTTSLVADQREYPFDSDIISRIKRVEAQLDGTDWVKLDEIDITSIKTPISSEAEITKEFTNNDGEAFYDLKRKAIYLYTGTLIAVTNGLKAWINTYPTAITDLTSTTDMSQDPSTTTHGIPRALHELWARGVVIEWKESREKPIPLTEREVSYNQDLEKAADTLKRANYDREVKGHVPEGTETWDDGFDL